MTEYACSGCEYTSPNKQHVANHINKKNSCSTGTKEIIEIPAEIKCKSCDKKFASKASMKRHSKNACKKKDDEKDQRIKELEEELKEARRITNINNTTNYIIVVNNYENTSLKSLSDKTYNKLLTKTESIHQIIPSLIKQIHFDPNTPENHNVYISNRNKNNKYLSVYRNGQWEIVNKDTEIDNMINDKETILSDWIGEKGQNYPKAVEQFNDYLDQKHEDNNVKLIKEEVEMILYNGRNMIKN
jgi:hypothetical protein